MHEDIERLIVDVVRRLIQREEVRLGPHGCAEDEARLLSRRHPADLTPGELLRNPEVPQVPEDLSRSHGPNLHPTLHRLHLLIIVANQLHDVWRVQPLVRLDDLQGLPGGVLLPAEARLLDLVHQGAAPHRPADHLRDHPGLRPELLLLGGESDGLELGELAVPPEVEAVLDVGERRPLKVLLQVVHAVLRDVRDPQGLMLPNLPDAPVGLELADHDAEQRRLAGAVAPRDGDAAVEAQLAADALELRRPGLRVGEPCARQPQDRLVPPPDALERAGVGENQRRRQQHGDLPGLRRRLLRRLAGRRRLRVGGRHRLGPPWQRRNDLRPELLEALEAAAEVREGPVVEVDDVRGDVGEEVVVVADDHHRRVVLLEVPREPSDSAHVEMVGGLVQHEEVGVLKNGASDGEAHSPTAAQLGDLLLLRLLREADLAQRPRGGCPVGTKLSGLLAHVLGDALPANDEDLVLDKDAADARGEPVDVLLGDAAEER
mmetsp:Transcript_20570/g.48980  ORF Transcript_20570/g.48980 Transcript_20570/m.48980 type:complete len:489 (+) Transcript_20570:147-1613(+)